MLNFVRFLAMQHLALALSPLQSLLYRILSRNGISSTPFSESGIFSLF
jgi:hypothetical protein